MSIFGFDLPLGVLIQGGCRGIAFGLLGLGLVLVYRSSRFINFAHSQTGAFGAAMLAVAVTQWGVPYWLALPFGMAVSAAIGAGLEISVVRRLERAPRVMSMVATLGVGQFLFFIGYAINAKATASEFFPEPAGFPTFTVDGQLIRAPYLGIAVLGPLTVIALVLFFTRTRYGLAIRAAAANPDAAAMAAMSPQRLATLTWAIAGAVACITAAMLIPTLSAVAGAALGPTLLLRALAAAVIGRMRDLTTTFCAGIAIGVSDALVGLNYGGGETDLVLLGLIVVALLLQAKPGRREDEKGTWLAVQPWAPLPEAISRAWPVRALPAVLGLGAAVLAVVLPSWLSNADSVVYAALLSFVMVGFSLTVITGLSGQLSLGQLGVAAVGAVAAIDVVHWSGNYSLGLLAGAAAGLVVSVLIGLPALRVQGLLLAVATLAFSLAAVSWILPLAPPLGLGAGRDVGRVELFGWTLDTARETSRAIALLAIVAFVLTAAVRRSSFGRLLVALRDNEDAARAFGIRATARKLEGYAVAGVIAGFAGASYAYAQSQSTIGPLTFETSKSIAIVTLTVVGGIGLLAGPVLGAFTALPAAANWGPEVSGLVIVGWVTLILYCPNGVAGAVRPLRDALVRLLARAARVDVEPAYADSDPARATTTASRLQLEPAAADARAGEPLLTALSVTKRYGGLVAVDGVSLDVRRGEVLGLIGPNGAGKTTFFECLSGFVRVDGGSIGFDGRDVTRWSPERRASAGLIRSFQDSALFSTLTVLETALVAGERAHPTRLASALVGASRAERRREERARELLSLLGLDRYRHTQVGALSTGTRRIAELACMVTLEPTLLLLDEPSSGVAQREVEALGEVLLRIKEHLGATLVLIEHDIALVSALSDRLVAMETGRILALGTPAEVLADDAVVTSYLGGDPTAVHRSAAGGPRTRTTSSQRTAAEMGA